MLQCVFEIDTSLTGCAVEYTWDIYTALLDTAFAAAVGIVTGLAAVDNGTGEKAEREKCFPEELLRLGMSFECADGEASVPKDKDRIMRAIGGAEEQRQLNCTVHGRVAAASLVKALEQGGDLAERSMQAFEAGRLVQLQMNLKNSAADTVQNMQRLVAALDPQTLQHLALGSDCWKQAGEWLAAAIRGRQFVKLVTLDLNGDLLLDCTNS